VTPKGGLKSVLLAGLLFVFGSAAFAQDCGCPQTQVKKKQEQSCAQRQKPYAESNPTRSIAPRDLPAVYQKEAYRAADAANVVAEFTPEFMLCDVKAIAVIPGVKKAAFLVGVRWGKGLLTMRDPDGRWMSWTITGRCKFSSASRAGNSVAGGKTRGRHSRDGPCSSHSRFASRIRRSMDNLVSQAWHEIAARPEGPLALRFYLQPLMATFFALRDGLKDARSNRPPYFWALFTHSTHRKELVRNGWQSIGKIFIASMALDLVYQAIVLDWLRPLQTIVVASMLAIAPYLTLRGPANRAARKWISWKSCSLR